MKEQRYMLDGDPTVYTFETGPAFDPVKADADTREWARKHHNLDPVPESAGILASRSAAGVCKSCGGLVDCTGGPAVPDLVGTVLFASVRPEPPLDAPRDWRGTPILVGSTVIYGAGVGRSIELVEATVLGFTDSGRVRLHVERRRWTGQHESKPARPVDVGSDRLTVVDLAPSELPTQDAQRAEHARKRAVWEPLYAAWTDGGGVGPRPQFGA